MCAGVGLSSEELGPDADYDEVYITQVGPDQESSLRFYEREVLPAFAKSEERRSA